MASPYWNLESKVENAVVSVLRGRMGDVPAYVGYGDWMLEDEQMVSVFAPTSRPKIPDSDNPNRIVTVTVTVRTRAGEPREGTPADLVTLEARVRHERVVAFAFDTFHLDDITDRLTAVPVIDLNIDTIQANTVTRATDGHSMVTTLELDVYANPKDA